MTTLICPNFVMVGKKRFALNLNVYRNAHYMVLSKAKVNFHSEMKPQIINMPTQDAPISIEYTLFSKTKRLCDVANVCSIVDKFLCDALVTCGIICDDNYEHLTSVKYSWGGIDKDNPRIEAKIIENCRS